MMPTIPGILADLFPAIASYRDMVFLVALASGLILVAAGIRLVRSAGTTRKPGYKSAIALLAGSVLIALLIGVPFFVPYPHEDYLVPGVPFFPFWLLVAWLATMAFYRAKARRPLAAVLFGLAALAPTPLLIAGTASLLGMGYSPNLIWTAYLIPPVVAGGLLARARESATSRYYSLYIAAWLVVAALVILPWYIGEMYNYQDSLESGNAALRYQNAPGAQQLIDSSLRAQLTASIIYVAATLLLLFLPLFVAQWPALKRRIYARYAL